MECHKKAEIEGDEQAAFSAISSHMMQHFGITGDMLQTAAGLMGLGDAQVPGQGSIPYPGSGKDSAA